MNQVAQATSISNRFQPDSPKAPNSSITGSLAPLRFEAKASYDTPPEKLFTMVSEADNLHRWLPMIKTVKMDHSHSEKMSLCNVGSVRQCSFSGMGDVDESIIWWKPPHSYWFSFEPKGRMKMMIPTTDHVIAFISESDGKGGSIFTLQVYFNWRGVFMRYMAVHMMPMLLNKALANLQKELGGAGGKMRRVA